MMVSVNFAHFNFKTINSIIMETLKTDFDSVDKMASAKGNSMIR